MNVLKMLRDAMNYLSEGAGRFFSPNNDHYPATGVQPFDGEPFSEWVELRNTK